MNRKIIKTTIASFAIVAFALPVLAASMAPTGMMDESGSQGQHMMSTKPTTMMKTTYDFSCVATATSKREDAIIAGWNAYASAIATAYQHRESAYVAAWGPSSAAMGTMAMSDVNKTTAAANKQFTKDSAVALKAWKAAQNSANKQFKTDKAACVKK